MNLIPPPRTQGSGLWCGRRNQAPAPGLGAAIERKKVMTGNLKNPLLGTATGEFLGRKAARMNVCGGVHYLKGNSAPHFSLTCYILKSGHVVGGGCMHDEILKRFPRLKPLVALHLSDISGAPMHAEANGWYQLAGALGGMGEQYHSGNSNRNFPATPPPGKPWQNTEHRFPTPAECLESFAEHCRIPVPEAGALAERVRAVFNAAQAADVPLEQCRAAARAVWAEACEAMRPRWLAEANECIVKLKLRLYGNQWDGAASHAALNESLRLQSETAI